MEDIGALQANQQNWNMFMSKKEVAFFNTRVSRYSPRYPFLEKRTNSFEKVQSKFNFKKKLLFDEQLIHSKAMINENKALIKSFLGKSLPVEQYAQTNKLACKAEQQYTHMLNYLRNHSWMIQKEKRNYSQPKYRPTLRYNDLPKKSQYKIQPIQPGKYFLQKWQELEDNIIFFKSVKTRALVQLTKKTKIQDFLQTCNRLWRNIIHSLTYALQFAEIDFFSLNVMKKSLLQYRKFLQHEQLCLTNSLFPKQIAYRCRGMNEQAITKLRIIELKKFADQIGIKVENDSLFDINKIYYNFKTMKNRVRYQNRRLQLKKVFKVSKVETAEDYIIQSNTTSDCIISSKEKNFEKPTLKSSVP